MTTVLITVSAAINKITSEHSRRNSLLRVSVIKKDTSMVMDGRTDITWNILEEHSRS